jgi:hypothetical protein
MKILSFSRLAAITGCLLFISGAHAQTNPSSGPTASDYGLLGKSYFAFDADLIKYRQSPSSPTGFGSDLVLNVEANDYLDLGFAYDFNHAKNTAWRTTDNIGRINTTGFVKFAHAAPYATVGLGYGWEHSALAKGTPLEGTRFHRALYDLGTGVEVPLVKQTSVRLGVGYEESFRQPHPKDMNYQLALDYQFDDTFCTDIGANIQDGRNGNRDTVVYRAGIRIIFD